jgi:PTH2 family peptidyl-tRNA hydrolase
MTDVKMVFVVRKDLHMRAGKIAAQVAHATQYAMNELLTEQWIYGKSTYEVLTAWENNRNKKICVYCDDGAHLLAIREAADAAHLPNYHVVDDGLTEFKGVPTGTVIAIGPIDSSVVDAITGNLKLC